MNKIVVRTDLVSKGSLNIVEWELLYIQIALNEYEHRWEQARALGISDRTLIRRMKEYNLI